MIRKLRGLTPAAAAPGGAAGTATAPAATATPAAASTAAATTPASATAAAGARHLNVAAGIAADIFPVEHMERRQADVCDFFFTKRNLMAKACGRRHRCIRRRHSRCRRTAHHRKCQTGCPQDRNGFRHVFFLRRLFYTLHSRNLHTCIWFDSSIGILTCGKSPRKAITLSALNSTLLVGVCFILMNEIFIFIHQLFINICSEV
ncbi:MAG TPA: hypothetical protein VHB49_15870 [Bradyrhizobium sp.]|nr:hypothetical protein [Bradyrhizobium sp.]